MQNDISNRHRGDLNGRFTDSRLPAKIVVTMTVDTAQKPAAQHLTWMLLNLLARQTEEIREIELNIPDGIVLAEMLSPLISRKDDLLKALEEGVENINPYVLKQKQAVRSVVSIRIGQGDLPAADFSIAASADGWAGYVGSEAAEDLGDDANPIGAYAAAALCAGEVFKFVRSMRDDSGSYARRLWLDAYRFQLSKERPASSPKLPSEIILPRTVLAGVGAVANGFLHALYPLPNVFGEIIALDGDREGITDTNLNRYVLFGLPHIEAPHLKASTAAAMFRESDLKITAFNGWWQEWRSGSPNEQIEFALSAVDKNSARHAIQDALPEVILGASTNEMRAQVNFYDVVNGGPCLKCRNKIEESIADEVIINNLRRLSRKELKTEAERIGVNLDDLKKFLKDPHANCGKMAGATLQRFAGMSATPEWSVGFVSLLAGVLLAAEYLKNGAETLSATLTADRSQFRFQFWRPENAEVNTASHLPAEENCICQSSVFKLAINKTAARRKAQG